MGRRVRCADLPGGALDQRAKSDLLPVRSNRSQSSSSRLASSAGSGKISTAAPSGSFSSFERATAVIPLPFSVIGPAARHRMPSPRRQKWPAPGAGNRSSLDNAGRTDYRSTGRQKNHCRGRKSRRDMPSRASSPEVIFAYSPCGHRVSGGLPHLALLSRTTGRLIGEREGYVLANSGDANSTDAARSLGRSTPLILIVVAISKTIPRSGG
jgi:hypothetical protein